EPVELLAEIRHVLECAVYRGETHVAHVVELAQFGHHEFTDPSRRDLALGGHAQLVHDGAHRGLDLLFRYRPLLQRAVEPLAQLARIELVAAAVALDDHRQLQLHRLQRAETFAARLALAPAADRGAVLADARVDDTGVSMLAEGAVHQGSRDSGLGTRDSGKGTAGGRLAIHGEPRALLRHLP